MNIGLYFNDHGFNNLDLSEPIKGNNGIGGTQYCFLMLADTLVKQTNSNVFLYHYNSNKLPNRVKSRIIKKRSDIINIAIKDKLDILIFKAEGITDLTIELRKTNIHGIAWAHNYLLPKELTEYYRNDSISRVVFVSHEMYDRYMDHPIIDKSSFIYNMYDGRNNPIRKIPKTPSVTYTGSLVPAKGFHILAAVWKKIVKAVPDAQLYVIGSGKLYDRNAKLGSHGVAQNDYEEKFIPYLSKNGKIMESVHFLGTMGHEKSSIYEVTTVGVINPTGRTETFGLSAIEMSSYGIPVVTKKTNGLYDTVIDGKTGYLIKSKWGLYRKIAKLLKDESLNIKIGITGKKFSDKTFLPEDLCKEWVKLFDEIIHNKKPRVIKPTNHYLNNAKWLRILNRRFHKIGLKTKPIINIEYSVMNIIKRRRRNNE